MYELILTIAIILALYLLLFNKKNSIETKPINYQISTS